KFVFVDPRLNESSYAHGAEWVPIKPGTDAAFILALIHVIIKEKLYDEAFLLNFSNAPILIKPDSYPLKNKEGEYLVWDEAAGNVAPLNRARQLALLGSYEVELDTYRGVCQTAFQLLAGRAEAYPSEVAAGITTIPKEKITEIARDLGTMKPHLCICSQYNVTAQYSNSLQYNRARNILMCLLGIYDKPGGKYYGPSGSDGISLNKEEDFRIPVEVHPMTKDRVDYDPTVHPIVQTKLKDYPIGVIQNVLKAIQTGKPYAIKVLFIIGSDVIASQSWEWREAFQKVEFIVKSHVWPDDDVDYADIVLPEAAYLERDDGFIKVTVPDPEHKDTEFSFLTVIPPVVEPQFEERAWTDYVKELAQRMGFGEYYDFTLDEYWNFLLEPAGIDIDYLRKHGVYYPTPLVTRKPEFGKKQQWTSGTGRQNIYTPEMVDLWYKKKQAPLYDPLPAYHPITVEPKADNEFYLLSGKCSYFKCNFYKDNAMLLEKYLEGELGNTKLWINANRAATLGIKDGDWAWIESGATGQKDKVRIKVTEGIHPSAAWHIYGGGHKSKLMDTFSRGREGINVNDFIPQHQVPFTAGAAHCEAVVKVYKA
ncbi:molybdopterin-dependent oxidoreductase, partial [Chloroflexota bacterium]